MKSKTMLSSVVCCSDDFRDMSTDAQALYLQMNLVADGDGFVDGMKSFMRSICASQETLDELIAAGFVLLVEGMHLIRHWWVNNNRDRMHDTHGCHLALLEQIAFESDTYRAYCFRKAPKDDTDETDKQTSDSLVDYTQSGNRLQVVEDESLIELESKRIKEKENRSDFKIEDELNPLIPAETSLEDTPSFYLAPCPKCGKECLVTSAPPYYSVCEEHGYFDVPGGRNNASGRILRLD